MCDITVGLVRIGGVLPLVVIPAAVGLLAAVVVALTSRNDPPPRYHFVSYCHCIR